MPLVRPPASINIVTTAAAEVGSGAGVVRVKLSKPTVSTKRAKRTKRTAAVYAAPKVSLPSGILSTEALGNSLRGSIQRINSRWARNLRRKCPKCVAGLARGVATQRIHAPPD